MTPSYSMRITVSSSHDPWLASISVEPGLAVGFARAFVEDRGVEGVLVGEVLEDERFGDACRGRNLARRRAAEAAFGEDPAGGFDQLSSPLGQAEAPGGGP